MATPSISFRIFALTQTMQVFFYVSKRTFQFVSDLIIILNKSSSNMLKKEISKYSVMIVQSIGIRFVVGNEKGILLLGCNATRMMVSFWCDIKKASPWFNAISVPSGASHYIWVF